MLTTQRAHLSNIRVVDQTICWRRRRT